MVANQLSVIQHAIWKDWDQQIAVQFGLVVNQTTSLLGFGILPESQNLSKDVEKSK